MNSTFITKKILSNLKNKASAPSTGHVSCYEVKIFGSLEQLIDNKNTLTAHEKLVF